ncbi:phage major capsid protein [Atlantibacter hermannii]|uniref:phage major capsid protein n=1 Tax=Atlantibacter hermannii TaxID=565 RepID=UPI0032543505
MKKLLELRQQKAALKAQMRSMLDKADSEKRSLNDEEGKQFDELRAQADALETEITRLEAVAEDQRNLPGTSVEGKSVSNEELRHYIITGDTRALSTLVQADGGFTVIPELDKEIMRQLSDESVMRQISTVKTISSNEYKKLVSVGGATVKHGEEGQPRTETSTPKLEEVSIKLFPIYAYPKTTQEILDFSDVDILGWLSSEISDTFTETEETDLLEGDGNKKARGFLDYPRAATSDKTRPFGTLEKIETAGAAPTADELIDLLFKLKSKYRKNAVWVMNSGSAAALQKLKNGNGDYIWRDRLTAGSPDTLLGRPVYYLETMSDATGGEPVLAVGDFKRGYYVVDHTTGVRTRPDSITEPGFYKVHTDKYLGGGVVDSNAIKILEIGGAGS